MAFLGPEDELDIYNQLSGYCDTAENLTTRISESNEISLKQKNEIFYPMVDELKELSASLIEEYILYLKDKDNTEKLEELRDKIDLIIEKIDIFKNKIYDVYCDE